MTIGLPNNHADELEKAVKKWANYYKVSVDFSAKQISDFLDGCFFSSLLQEEERSLTFRAAFISKNECVARDYQTIDFDEAVPFSPDRMKKLALIANNDVLSLCVRRGEKGLEAWGIVLLQSMSGLDNYLLCPLVKILGPARLQFVFASHTLLQYSAENDFVAPEKCWPRHLFSILRELKLEPENNVILYSCITNAIIRQGHGGTLLVSSHKESLPVLLQGGKDISFHNPHNIPEFIADLAEAQSQLSEQSSKVDKLRVEIQGTKYLALLTALGMFSAIDGAIVLQRDWSYCGFGKTILVNEADMDQKMRIVKLDPYKESEVEFDKIRDYPGGTRHRSAIAFCKNSALGFAIVVSQDRTVSLVFSPKKDEISVVTPFLPFELIYDPNYGTKMMASLGRN